MLTLQQKIAQKQAELARLKEQERKERNGSLFVVGAISIDFAEEDKVFREMLIKRLEQKAIRPADKKRVLPLIERLRAM